jgi:hypothetical protein
MFIKWEYKSVMHGKSQRRVPDGLIQYCLGVTLQWELPKTFLQRRLWKKSFVHNWRCTTRNYIQTHSRTVLFSSVLNYLVKSAISCVNAWIRHPSWKPSQCQVFFAQLAYKYQYITLRLLQLMHWHAKYFIGHCYCPPNYVQ